MTEEEFSKEWDTTSARYLKLRAASFQEHTVKAAREDLDEAVKHLISVELELQKMLASL